MLKIVRDANPIGLDEFLRAKAEFQNFKVNEDFGEFCIVLHVDEQEFAILDFDPETGEISCECDNDEELVPLFDLASFLGGRVSDDRFTTYRDAFDVGYVHPLDKSLRTNMLRSEIGRPLLGAFGWICLGIFTWYMIHTDFDLYYQVAGRSEKLSPAYYQKLAELRTELPPRTPALLIMPTADFGMAHAERLAKKLRLETGLTMEVIAPFSLSHFLPIRGDQYSTADLLESANEELAARNLLDSAVPTIVITTADIADPDSDDRFRFHSADLFHNVAILSNFRLKSRDYLLRESDAMGDIRLIKYMKRSLGVMLFKLTTNEDPSNFMFVDVQSTGDIDAMETF